MTNSHPLQCRCGTFRAEVAATPVSTRAVCYCRDCQAFARFLGPPPGMLDELGGTDIVAVRPRDVTFLSGIEQLACMSLSPHGTVRWFTACCRTPIGNTPRDRRVSHVGLIHTVLAVPGHDLGTSFGPVRMHVNRHGAHGIAPRTAPPAFAWALLRYGSGLAWSRISGRYRINPFFDASTGRPRSDPRVLSLAERRELETAT